LGEIFGFEQKLTRNAGEMVQLFGEQPPETKMKLDIVELTLKSLSIGWEARDSNPIARSRVGSYHWRPPSKEFHSTNCDRAVVNQLKFLIDCAATSCA